MVLKTLGGLELVGSFAARPSSRPKPLLLLAYLAVKGTKERHHLAEPFWPEAAEPINSLRVALTQLRASAPGAIGVTAGGAMLSAELEEWVYATREFLARRLQHLLLQQAERLTTEGAFPEAARDAGAASVSLQARR